MPPSAIIQGSKGVMPVYCLMTQGDDRMCRRSPGPAGLQWASPSCKMYSHTKRSGRCGAYLVRGRVISVPISVPTARLRSQAGRARASFWASALIRGGHRSEWRPGASRRLAVVVKPGVAVGVVGGPGRPSRVRRVSTRSLNRRIERGRQGRTSAGPKLVGLAAVRQRPPLLMRGITAGAPGDHRQVCPGSIRRWYRGEEHVAELAVFGRPSRIEGGGIHPPWRRPRQPSALRSPRPAGRPLVPRRWWGQCTSEAVTTRRVERPASSVGVSRWRAARWREWCATLS